MAVNAGKNLVHVQRTASEFVRLFLCIRRWSKRFSCKTFNIDGRAAVFVYSFVCAACLTGPTGPDGYGHGILMCTASAPNDSNAQWSGWNADCVLFERSSTPVGRWSKQKAENFRVSNINMRYIWYINIDCDNFWAGMWWIRFRIAGMFVCASKSAFRMQSHRTNIRTCRNCTGYGGRALAINWQSRCTSHWH